MMMANPWILLMTNVCVVLHHCRSLNKLKLIIDWYVIMIPFTGSEWKRLMSLFMQLRKVCNHPYLFQGAEPRDDSDDDNISGTSTHPSIHPFHPDLT
jgi:DNA-binding response OmpR family regulator